MPTPCRTRLIAATVGLTSNYTSDSNWILAKAYLLWRLSRYEDLLNLLNSLPSYFHADALFWLLRGLALKATRSEISEVLECYQFAYNIDNSRFDVCFNLANTLFEHDNKNPSCEPLYIRSLYLDPLNADCWYNYSKYLLENGRPSESLTALKSAIVLSPINPDYYCNYGLSYYAMRIWSCSERSFLLAISLDNRFYRAHMNLGSLLISSRLLQRLYLL